MKAKGAAQGPATANSRAEQHVTRCPTWAAGYQTYGGKCPPKTRSHHSKASSIVAASRAFSLRVRAVFSFESASLSLASLQVGTMYPLTPTGSCKLASLTVSRCEKIC